jgi:hypothetical protein
MDEEIDGRIAEKALAFSVDEAHIERCGAGSDTG